MTLIYESKSFCVEAHEQPHVDRDEGGHIVIRPKQKIPDRQHLSPQQATELMRLTMIVGEAMIIVMNNHGVDLSRINYQDNGNWGVFKEGGPHLHVHLYGRAKSAKVQKYGQACYFPHIEEDPEYYSDFKPLKTEDVKGIEGEIIRLGETEKYLISNWTLD